MMDRISRAPGLRCLTLLGRVRQAGMQLHGGKSDQVVLHSDRAQGLVRGVCCPSVQRQSPGLSKHLVWCAGVSRSWGVPDRFVEGCLNGLFRGGACAGRAVPACLLWQDLSGITCVDGQGYPLGSPVSPRTFAPASSGAGHSSSAGSRPARGVAQDAGRPCCCCYCCWRGCG